MRFDGMWLVCDDGVARPAIRVQVQDADGAPATEPFLLDTLADRTVLSAAGTLGRISGEFAAFTDPQATDLSILGRDVLNHFDVIVSRRRNEVTLLALNHSYQIVEA